MVQLITIKTTGMDSGIRRYQDQRQILQNPDMAWGVRRVAGVWNRNFVSEGRAVGGWRELSEYTQALRERRGFPGAHPILRQTGALHRVAIRSLMDARSGKTSTGQGVSMSFTIPDRGRAFLRLTGEKVRNHYGDRSKNLPARQFWFVNGDVESAAAEGINKWYSQELRRMG